MLRSLRLSLAAAFLCATMPLAAASNQVWVVGNLAQGADVSTIQQAVDLAAPGDIVLVKSGNYTPATVDGKGLSIVADAGATVKLTGSSGNTKPALRVRNVPAGEQVLVFGLALVQQVIGMPAVELAHNSGNVCIEQCTAATGFPAVTVLDCAAATFIHCSFAGKDSGPTPQFVPGPASPGLLAESSSVSIQGCTITGGKGYKAGVSGFFKWSATEGAAAVRVVSGQAVIGGGLLTGGDGANGSYDFPGGPFLPCLAASSGGSGIELTTGAPLAMLHDVQLVPGVSGSPYEGCPPPPVAGPRKIVTGSILDLDGSAPTLATSSPLRESQLASITVTGKVHTAPLLAVSAVAKLQALPALSGVLSVGAPLLLLPVGALPAEGFVVLEALVPDLGPGLEGAVVYLQAACLDPDVGHVVLGPPATLTLLDASF